MLLPVEKQRVEALERLARDHFGAITAAERNVLQESASFEGTDSISLENGLPVRSTYLRWLITDKDACAQIDPRGVRVSFVTVSGRLNLDDCTIKYPLFFHFCQFDEEISIKSAKVHSLTIYGGKVQTILGGEAEIRGSVRLFTQVTGTVDLANAQVGGDLDFSGTKFTMTEAEFTKEALHAYGVRVSGSVYLREGFKSRGLIELGDSRIDKRLDCDGAHLVEAEVAMNLNGARIGEVDFRGNFWSDGIINLVGTEIAGDLDCQGAGSFKRLACDKLRVGGRLVYLDIANPSRTELWLFGASVGELHDDEKSWPEQNNLILNGLVYQELLLHKRAMPEEVEQNKFGNILPLDADRRIEWLRRQNDRQLDNAQPWLHLAKTLETAGDVEGAKHVVYEFHQYQKRNSPFFLLNSVYNQVEELPLRVAWPIAFFWGLGSLVFWRAHRIGAMKASAGDADNGKGVAAPRAATPFQPVVYALENVLPVVKLGQDSAWTPDPAAPPGSWLPDWKRLDRVRKWAAKWRFARWMVRLNYERLAILRWTLILVGWVLALILASAIGEQFKR